MKRNNYDWQLRADLFVFLFLVPSALLAQTKRVPDPEIDPPEFPKSLDFGYRCENPIRPDLLSGQSDGPVTEPKPDPSVIADLSYPAAAKRAGQGGIVVVEMLVTENGQVGHAAIYISSGHPLLDNAALQSLRGVKLVPGTKNDKPACMFYKLKFTFAPDDLLPRPATPPSQQIPKELLK